MPYHIKKQKCTQTDGDAGQWVLSYTDNKGKKRKYCHTSKKKAKNQIAAISISKNELNNKDDQMNNNKIKLTERQLKNLIKVLIEQTDVDLSPQKTAQLLIDKLKAQSFKVKDSPFKNEKAHIQFAWLITNKKMPLFETFQEFKSILKSVKGFEEMFENKKFTEFGQKVTEEFVKLFEKLIEKETGIK